MGRDTRSKANTSAQSSSPQQENPAPQDPPQDPAQDQQAELTAEEQAEEQTLEKEKTEKEAEARADEERLSAAYEKGRRDAERALNRLAAQRVVIEADPDPPQIRQTRWNEPTQDSAIAAAGVRVKPRVRTTREAPTSPIL